MIDRVLQKKLHKKMELVTAPYEVCLNETTIEGILLSSLRTNIALYLYHQ